MVRKNKADRESLIDPRCCKYRLDQKHRKHVNELLTSNDIDKDTKSRLELLMDEDECNKNTLTYESLVTLHKYIQRADRSYMDPFYVFAETCKRIEPKPRDNEQLEKRLQQLRFRESHAIYEGMTSSVDRLVENKILAKADAADSRQAIQLSTGSSVECPKSTLTEVRELYGSAIAVFNSFLVFLCTFLMSYKALEYALPVPNIIAQTSFGLFCSLVVAVAELYFLMRVV